MLSDDMLSDEMAREHALGTHSAIMHHGSRIWSSKCILAADHPMVNDAVRRIVPRIDMHQIRAIIDETEYVSGVRKDFYKSVLQYGYDLVLRPAYENLISKNA